MKSFGIATVLSALLSTATAASTFNPARPPAIPIAVRNPYLSTWLDAGSDGGNGGYLPGEWTTFFDNQVTAWTGLIKVDGLNYVWMGAPAVNPAALATQVAFNYTSTRSIFTINAGPVQLIVEFLSPITPDDYVRSSLASSYLNVQVTSLDGAMHSVQIYTDISGEWLSGNRDDFIQWSNGVVANPSNFKRDAPPAVHQPEIIDGHKVYGTKTNFIATKPPPQTATSSAPQYTWSPNAVTYTTYAADAKATAPVIKAKKGNKPGVNYHQIFRQSQDFPDENTDQALWGNWYYATANTENTTYQIAADTVVRGNFINYGSLNDTIDPNFRAINVAYPCFAYSVNLGMVGISSQSVLWTINLLQTPVIDYENGLINRNVTLNGLWTKYFNDDLDAVSFFYEDYAKSSKMSTKLDNKIQNDAVKVGGQDYATIATLAVRQAFGGLQLAANGTADNFYVFMKEISSDGNIQTVDVMFPLHPILIYLNPEWVKLMLEPIFVNTEAGYWPYAFTIHDLGNHYPVAFGNNNGNDEMQPLEECGNMLIMSLAYAQRANDNAWLASHYNVLRQWTGFLVQEALIPANQISTDDFAGSLANQTNLAIKGIIGIGAMAEIANRTGNAADYANFSAIALDYIKQWQVLGIAHDATPPHTTLNYGSNDTYGLLYNLFGDSELNLGLVPQSVYDMQSAFYPTVFQQFGVPLDTRHTYTKLDWETWAASIASPATAQEFYHTLATWVNETPSIYPLGDWYDTIAPADTIAFHARPVVGGLFAPLALKSAPKKNFFKNRKGQM